MPEEPETPSLQPTTDPSTNPTSSAPTSEPTSATSPSSPKLPPPPINTSTASNALVQPESSITATTPAAMETAMRFETAEVRKSLNLPPPPTANTSTEPSTEDSGINDQSNTITATAPATGTTTASAPESPGIAITLLILSGARSTFTLNPEYMARHNVSHSDPMDMTVHNLKECVWRDWKEDELNTSQPPSPHLIRLILLGRLLEDKSLLKDCRLNWDGPNVVHLSLRPADVSEDEVTSKNGKFPAFSGAGNRTGERASASCRCVIL